jgi:hypothetical protein
VTVAVDRRDRYAERDLACWAGDYIDERLPDQLVRTLGTVRWVRRSVDDTPRRVSGWWVGHVPESHFSQNLYRRYQEVNGDEYRPLQVARLGSWFIALLGEHQTDPWRLVTLSDLKLGGYGWPLELRRDWESWSLPDPDLGPTTSEVAQVGREKIRFDRVRYGRRGPKLRLPDLGVTWDRPWEWPKLNSAVQVEIDDEWDCPPLVLPPPDVCEYGGCGNTLTADPLKVRWIPGAYGRKLAVCRGHFNAQDAVSRSWLSVIGESSPDRNDVPKQIKAIDPLSVRTPKPYIAKGRTAPTHNRPAAADDLDGDALFEFVFEEEDRMLLSFALDDLTQDEMADKLGISKRQMARKLSRLAADIRHRTSMSTSAVLSRPIGGN